MVFASPIFLYVFLPLTLLAYYMTPRRVKALTLTLMSFAFYAWWRPDFVLLMTGSAGVDYIAGLALGKTTIERRRKIWLVVSCCMNLGLLAYFKYANFGISSFNALLTSFGFAPLTALNVVLPVGISFYTFQSMSYTIDVYRREVEPIKDPIAFLCYISMFPQLVAGPIVRYIDVAKQLQDRTHTTAKFAFGAMLFEMGFIKKVLIADALAPVANQAYALADPGFLEAWIGTITYGFQIYFDFSGYSDMAIGLGLLFGFVFPVNFDSPYLSQSITEFWRRWHISLSTWLRDYLYIPLGGNRHGASRTYACLLATMLLGGLWHGAAWTFVAWGAYQGLFLMIERMNGKKPFYHAWPAPMRIAATFLIAMGGWVFFRAESITQAGMFLSSMVGANGGFAGVARLEFDRLSLVMFAIAALVAFGAKPSHKQAESPNVLVAYGVPLAFLVAVSHLFFQQYRPFLYFQF